MKQSFSIHPVAALFPPLPQEEFEALKADIAKHGVRMPVLLLDGKILDGQNRWRACKELGVECPTKQWNGKDPWFLAQSLNLRRRHLSPAQVDSIRRLAQAELPELAAEIQSAKDAAKKREHAGKSADGTGGGRGKKTLASRDARVSKASETIAKATGVSAATVERVDRAVRLAPEKLPAMAAGEVTPLEIIREAKEAKREEKREADRKLCEAAPDVEAVAGKVHFPTIVIDPPWDWGDEGDQDQLGRARPTYETWPIKRLCDPKALPLAQFADKDCHLYLWITNRSLPKGFALLESWGFRYVTCLTWCKPSFGMGNYFRGATEQILFGVKGSLALKRKDVGTWFEAPRGKRHSEKPEEFYELVESCSPGPYLEMFARREREGWMAWGAEIVHG